MDFKIGDIVHLKGGIDEWIIGDVGGPNSKVIVVNLRANPKIYSNFYKHELELIKAES